MLGPGTISLRLILELGVIGIVLLNLIVMGLLLRALLQLEQWLHRQSR